MMGPERIAVPNAVILGETVSLLREGKDVLFAPKGVSMIPFIVEGRDCVRLRKLDKVAVGDIVLVCMPDCSFLLHRVTAIDGDMLTLMGDGNLQLRESCVTDRVCGTAIALVRADGTERDLRSASSLRRAWLWRKLLPFRRVLLWVYRRTTACRHF